MQYKHVCYITTDFRWFYNACQNFIIFCTNEKQFISSVVQSCIVTPLQVFIQVLIYCLVKLVVTIMDIFTRYPILQEPILLKYFFGSGEGHRLRRCTWQHPPPPSKHSKSLWTPYWIWIVLIRYFKCRNLKGPYNLLRAEKRSLKYMTTKNVYCQIQCFRLH